MSYLFAFSFTAYAIIQAVRGDSIKALFAMAICALFTIAGNIAELTRKIDYDSSESES